jgi:hypothetical protein
MAGTWASEATPFFERPSPPATEARIQAWPGREQSIKARGVERQSARIGGSP